MSKLTQKSNNSSAIAKQIGARIKLARGDTSQKELSTMVEMHLNTIGNIERGESPPDCIQLIAIASVLEVSVTWLLLGVGNMRNADKVVTNENAPRAKCLKEIPACTLEMMIGECLQEKLAGTSSVSIDRVEYGSKAEMGTPQISSIQLTVSTEQ